jgi:hypothetical protein
VKLIAAANAITPKVVRMLSSLCSLRQFTNNEKQAFVPSFDHLVSDRQHTRRNGQAECFDGLEVNYEISRRSGLGVRKPASGSNCVHVRFAPKSGHWNSTA